MVSRARPSFLVGLLLSHKPIDDLHPGTPKHKRPDHWLATSRICSMSLSYHYYAFDAANLLMECLAQIEEVIEAAERERSRFDASSSSSLYDLKEALMDTERLIFFYFRYIVHAEMESSSIPQIHEAYDHQHHCEDLPAALDMLRFVLLTKSSCTSEAPSSPRHSFYPRRNVTDSLLFRLHVALQLCQMRIDDSRLVLLGRRRSHCVCKPSSASVVPVQQAANVVIDTILPLATGLLGVTTLSLNYARQNAMAPSTMIRSIDQYQPIIWNAARSGAALVALRWLHTKWRNLWMASKLSRSTEEIEEWNRQWSLVQSTPPIRPPRRPSSPPRSESPTNNEKQNQEAALDAARSQRLIEYALHETPKVNEICFSYMNCNRVEYYTAYSRILHTCSLRADFVLAFTR